MHELQTTKTRICSTCLTMLKESVIYCRITASSNSQEMKFWFWEGWKGRGYHKVTFRVIIKKLISIDSEQRKIYQNTKFFLKKQEIAKAWSHISAFGFLCWFLPDIFWLLHLLTFTSPTCFVSTCLYRWNQFFTIEWWLLIAIRLLNDRKDPDHQNIGTNYTRSVLKLT